VGLILDGEPTTAIPDGDKVHDDLRFVPGSNRHTRAWKAPPRGIVLHWTGAENGAGLGREWGVADTLEARDLSVHFVIEKRASEQRHASPRSIVQLADPVVTRCAHVGTPGNDKYIGIEIVNRGFATREDMADQPGLRDRSVIDWAEPRDVYSAVLDGRQKHLATFTPSQVEDTLWLVETLCGLLDIPRLVPMTRPTSATPARARELAVTYMGEFVPDFSRDPRKWHARSRVQLFEGVLGHFHLHPTRWDPGTQLFYALWAEGFNPTGQKFHGDLPT